MGPLRIWQMVVCLEMVLDNLSLVLMLAYQMDLMMGKVMDILNQVWPLWLILSMLDLLWVVE